MFMAMVVIHCQYFRNQGLSSVYMYCEEA
jgi:hypothetical protein